MRCSSSTNNSRVWEEARERADKIIKLIDTQARPVGEELVGFAKSDFDKLQKWADEYKSKVGESMGGASGTDGAIDGSRPNGRRKWHSTTSTSTEPEAPIDVEAN
jgi:hypothetical protein